MTTVDGGGVPCNFGLDVCTYGPPYFAINGPDVCPLTCNSCPVPDLSYACDVHAQVEWK